MIEGVSIDYLHTENRFLLVQITNPWMKKETAIEILCGLQSRGLYVTDDLFLPVYSAKEIPDETLRFLGKEPEEVIKREITHAMAEYLLENDLIQFIKQDGIRGKRFTGILNIFNRKSRWA